MKGRRIARLAVLLVAGIALLGAWALINARRTAQEPLEEQRESTFTAKVMADRSGEREEETALLRDPVYREEYGRLKKALGERPKDTRLLLDLSGLYLRRWMLRRAEDALREAYGIEPRNGEVLRQLSDVLCLRREFREAKAYAGRALEAAPGDGEAHTNYAQACFSLGEKEPARAHFLEGIRLKPDNPHTLTTYAFALRTWSPIDSAQHYRDEKEALELFRRATKAAPHLPEGWAGVAFHLYRLEDYPGALQNYLIAHEKDPENPETIEGLVKVYRKLGDTAKAARMEEKLRMLEAPAGAPAGGADAPRGEH